ncbi:MAG: hypothetical protein IKX36_06440 [Prevotella sp.]|nr:hypothetical protein [Prevotella sp.]
MKNKILFFILALSSIAVKAQDVIKVVPQYQVNDTAIYHNNGVSSISSMGVKTTLESAMDMTLVVKEKTSEGYVVKLMMSNVNVDSDDSNPLSEVLAMSIKMVEGCDMVLALDKEGRLQRIINYDEVKEAQLAQINKLIDRFFAKYPEVGDVMSKQTVMMTQLESQTTEEEQLKSLKSTANLFSFNGLELSLGAVSEYTNPTGIPMQRTVTKMDAKERYVEMTSESKASKEDIKFMLVERIKENMEEVGEEIIEYISSMVDSGMMSFDVQENANVRFFTNGYVKSIDIDNTTRTMGQDVNAKNTLTCIHTSF